MRDLEIDIKCESCGQLLTRKPERSLTYDEDNKVLLVICDECEPISTTYKPRNTFCSWALSADKCVWNEEGEL